MAIQLAASLIFILFFFSTAIARTSANLPTQTKWAEQSRRSRALEHAFVPRPATFPGALNSQGRINACAREIYDERRPNRNRWRVTFIARATPARRAESHDLKNKGTRRENGQTFEITLAATASGLCKSRVQWRSIGSRFAEDRPHVFQWNCCEIVIKFPLALFSLANDFVGEKDATLDRRKLIVGSRGFWSSWLVLYVEVHKLCVFTSHVSLEENFAK